MSRPEVRVGGGRIPYDDAHAWVTRYLSSPGEHWAYPAYESYPGGDSPALEEADLLAPVLLSTPVRSLETYYSLQENLKAFNAVLGAIPLETSLAGATHTDLAAVVDLFAFLDTHPMHDVSLAMFTKLLHRKRPHLIPLYDTAVGTCYLDMPDAPLVRDDRRAYASFAQLWLRAVQRDLDSQLDVWAELSTLTPTDGPQISPLRALDIVGWKVGSGTDEMRSAPAEA
ncbi:DUF6308 family protein [Sanguibacter suaedae]|uniref:Uncharacterized protein n=1 Tax=Sanguibacter suaedae TaxID=2795737 RepID=A0A934I799_9MICO|nr:DUF6308 family protein [Sanguibacter suaedae]MBI9113510.1 hypothetical protein [Sanguibacter suaedae]